jgi:hypothetical protein
MDVCVLSVLYNKEKKSKSQDKEVRINDKEKKMSM